MQIFVLIAIAIALIAAMFALQNIVPVTVSLLTWTFEGSLALMLFIAMMLGASASFLASFPSFVRGKRTTRSLRQKVAVLERELEQVRRERDAARPALAEPPAEQATLTPVDRAEPS